MKSIGFIGLGNMGGPMALNVLAKAGREVVVFDTRQEAMASCVKAGARAATDAASLAKECDVIYVSLPTPGLVESVLTAENGFISGANRDAVVIDLSTNSPSVAKRVERRLSQSGVAYLESPVTGGVAKAKDGTLTIMVGGDEAVFQRSANLYGHISTKPVFVGPTGAASTVKLINNMLVLCNLAAAAEGMAMAAKAGLDLEKFADVVRNGSGFSAGFRLIAGKPMNNDFSPQFALELAHKDFALAVALEAELEIPSIMSSPALSILKIARNLGYGALDCSAVLKVYEGFTGVEARIKTPDIGQ
ncbi:NAD(P)-dependent oxidoreductase [Bradyrhizobium sp. OAE829]|uniref:NAD(P)-dependent oxidoreductase n=1 Tax=Bradyrhizobium sp. OAE829 TaxID=2663807 RepID=UPI00178B6CB4